MFEEVVEEILLGFEEGEEVVFGDFLVVMFVALISGGEVEIRRWQRSHC